MLYSWVWLGTWSEEKKNKNYERKHVILERGAMDSCRIAVYLQLWRDWRRHTNVRFNDGVVTWDRFGHFLAIWGLYGFFLIFF